MIIQVYIKMENITVATKIVGDKNSIIKVCSKQEKNTNRARDSRYMRAQDIHIYTIHTDN